MNTIQNPVLKGFYPDPSILRVGEDYYIATSTFEWYPGVCIQHSRDLKHWETMPSPLRDDKVFDLRGIDTSCGIWAPNLTYDRETFYLIFTIVYTDRPGFKDTHNFVTTADSIEGPWSKPVFLNCSGFDPSLFHNDDGRKWLVNMKLDYRPSHKRFAGIILQEYDSDTQTLIGPVFSIFKGTGLGTTEGPNLYKHNGTYYLLCAEGGTGFRHSCTLARCSRVNGSYEACPNNPVLTSNCSEDCYLQRAGHGSIVETANHQWLMAHLCSRPIDQFSILGRETAIQNIEWTSDGWFQVIHDQGKRPRNQFDFEIEEETVYPHPVREEFDTPVIPKEFMTLRQSAGSCGISPSERKGFLRIHGGNSLSCKYEVGLLARRVQSLTCTCSTLVAFQPDSFCQTAGLVCYYNGDNYYYLKISRDEAVGLNLSVTSMINCEMSESDLIPLPPEDNELVLRAQIRGRELCFSYAVGNRTYQSIEPRFDMAVLSDEHVNGNGFTGAMVGMFCEDLERKNCYADFDWFEYSNL